MVAMQRQREEARVQNAFEYKLKNSLLTRYKDKVRNDSEMQFCKDVLEHLHNVAGQPKPIDFNIASIDEEREQVPMSNMGEVRSESVDKAKDMVVQIRKRAS